MLHKQLQGKTYFIVLDGVQRKEHWESLMAAFPSEQDQTSRLLLTTHNATDISLSHKMRFLNATGLSLSHKMRLLDPEKSWELFLMKTLIIDGCPGQLEPIGREIVKRCAGLPLQISVAGGFLAGRRIERAWEQFLEPMRGPELEPFPTFFRGDATIPAKTLQNIWVGQGLIQQDGTRPTEEIARGYLDELSIRNMIQILDLTMDGGVKNCYLHDVLRQWCLRRAEEEKARHRVVNGGDLETLSSNPGMHLRSLFLHNHEGGNADVSSVSYDFWKSSQLLKILHLDGIILSTFPDSLRALVRLKYLMIRRHKIHSKCALEVEDYIEALKLPNWLDGLKHLEIVDMEGEKVEFPNDVALKMKRLRYFSAYCIRGPKSINSWENIETLKYIRQEDWMKCYSTLSSSCNVRKLGLFLDPLNRADEWREVRDSLAKMEKLEHLQLQWSPIISIDPEIVPKLHSLTKLKLRGKLTKCPDIFHPRLSHLTLAFSDLSEDLMPKLNKLPELSYLKLLGNAYKPERIQVLSDSFLRLRVLTLKEMFHLESIHIQQGGMQSLQKLRIQHCPSLQTTNLPEHVVINYIA